MPLDRVNGEIIDDRKRDPATHEVAGPGVLYGAKFEVIEPEHLFSHDIRVEYEPAGAKFRSRTKRKTGYRHIGEDVAALAGQHFVDLGAVVPIRGLRFDDDDFLVQVYPDLLKVAVLVQRMIGGEEKMVTLVYPPEGVWPPALITSLLEAAGKRVPARH
jgi:hypothetical protein